MEDEYHFLNICPAYQQKKCSLLGYLENEYRIKISRMSPNKIFKFLTPLVENAKIQKINSKTYSNTLKKEKRKTAIKYSRT